MTGLRIFIFRLRGMFGTARSEKELNSEVSAHLDAMMEENLRRGMTPKEARYAARREFGGVEQIKEEYRETRGLPTLELCVQDLRYALRTLRKNPGFAVIAALTLALGIGANTAIFSIVNAVLLRPLPFPQSSRIVAVYQTLEREGVHRNGVSYLNFADGQKESHNFEQMGAFRQSDVTLTGSGEPEIIPGAVVTPSLLATLGVRPIAGRLLI